MSDLHAALLAAIKIRRIIAEAATPGPWEYATVRGVTSVGAPGVLPSVAADVPFDADVHHLLANSPDAVLRQCERDLKVLTRHEPQLDGMDRLSCACCEELCHSRSGLGCGSPDAPWPCIEITDLAEAYAIPVDATAGQTPGGTDG